MPKVGSVEFEKVGLKSPVTRLAGIALEIDLDREGELDKKKWRKERKVHPRNLRYDEYSRLMDKFEAGLDIRAEIEEMISSMEVDPEMGMFDTVVGYWYNFAAEHPQVISPERVGPVWKRAILEDGDPRLRLQSYCIYSHAAEDLDVELLVRFEKEALTDLPNLTQMEERFGQGMSGCGASLEHLLTLMSVMRQAGISTSIFEEYFETLIKGAQFDRVEVRVVLELIDYLRIYHKDEAEKVIRMIKSMVEAIQKGGLGNNVDSFLRQVSDDFAELDDFETANNFWREGLARSEFPASENPSTLLACALRTGNQMELMWLRLYQEAVVRRQIRQEAAESGGRYEASQLDDVDREWQIAWFFAIRFHLSAPEKEKYLVAEPFLAALREGVYDQFLDDLIDFCVAFPGLSQLRGAVRGRIEEGLTKINRGKLKKDSLEAINYLKAAIKWQKEVK